MIEGILATVTVAAAVLGTISAYVAKTLTLKESAAAQSRSVLMSKNRFIAAAAIFTVFSGVAALLIAFFANKTSFDKSAQLERIPQLQAVSGGEVAEGRTRLIGEDLEGRDLSQRDLGEAVLYRSNLSRVNLSFSHLSGADLSLADLTEANLTGANLENANLRNTDLSLAILDDASLNGADLSGARGLTLRQVCALRRPDDDSKETFRRLGLDLTHCPLPLSLPGSVPVTTRLEDETRDEEGGMGPEPSDTNRIQ